VAACVWRVEFPARLSHLLRNSSYLYVVCENVCNTYLIMGVYANLVRYLELVFHQPASTASVISGTYDDTIRYEMLF